jgi:FKBP-type peptidyl-prolyl cis-trans isomerase
MTGAQNSTPVTDILLNKVLLVRTGAKAEAFDWQAAVSDYEAKQALARAEQEAQEKTQMEALAKTLGIDLATAQLGDAGLKWVVRSAGTGAKPTKGQTITAHYTGYLANGTKFDSSVDRGQPFSTPIGVGKVIKGWDLAFQDMQVGEKRVLIIPANLGYGSAGAGGVIPPNATLVFDVELIGIQ